MPPIRLTQEIIEAILNSRDLPQYPGSGQLPNQGTVEVRDSNGGAHNVPVVVAHTFIAGSGPIGCTFARVLLDPNLNRLKPSVVIAEIGSQEAAVKGRNLKNSLSIRVIQGHMQPISVVPNHPVLNMYGNNPNQERRTNLPASAVTRTVGGMATHWTCCCPLPFGDERKNSPIPDELDDLLGKAGEYLDVKDDVFDDSIRHTIVKDTLLKAFPSRGIGNLPLGVKPRDDTRNYLTWTGSDTVLGSDAIPPDPAKSVVDRMMWMTETRVTYLVKKRLNVQNKIVAVVVRDYNKNDDILIIAKAFIIACGAVGTPQILFKSGINPPALGRYLSEQTIAFCQIVLKRSIINSANDYPRFKERIKEHRKAHPDDVLPIPFDELEPQVYIPYQPNQDPEKDFPWHVQIHRDAFSYGEVGPTVDQRIIVDLRFFGRCDINQDNRVEFPPSSSGYHVEWEAGDTDLYGMPQATFCVTGAKLTMSAMKGSSLKMMEDMKAVAQTLGEYLPGAEPQFMPAGLALHITGTTRMQPMDATSPEEIKKVSVVDKDSKVHDYENLWLGGCNVIPDSMGCNTTRTGIAYAIKSAEAVYRFLYGEA